MYCEDSAMHMKQSNKKIQKENTIYHSHKRYGQKYCKLTQCLIQQSAVRWSNCGNKNDKSIRVEQTIDSTTSDTEKMQ